MDKLNFLKNDLPKLFEKLDSNATGEWGVLNGQQMIEHMADSIREATGKLHLEILTPEDKLPKAKEFVMSDKEFRPGTKNIKMPETPTTVRNKTLQDAIEEYKNEVVDFINYFEEHKGQRLPNSFFGSLNFEEWVQLFYKHALHHAKQFKLL